ncbi:hypothetical protein [Dyadobacter bucti]|uniref:hypothetical protein n=1 Tax=Dyadobacter bucti TaxID=2572203 RepID=UPI003F70A3DD
MPEPSTLYEERCTLIEMYKASEAEKVRLEKTLIRIQNYLNDLVVDAPYAMFRLVRVEVLDLILQADSENDTPGPSTQAITDSQAGLLPNTGS